MDVLGRRLPYENLGALIKTRHRGRKERWVKIGGSKIHKSFYYADPTARHPETITFDEPVLSVAEVAKDLAPIQ